MFSKAVGAKFKVGDEVFWISYNAEATLAIVRSAKFGRMSNYSYDSKEVWSYVVEASVDEFSETSEMETFTQNYGQNQTITQTPRRVSVRTGNKVTKFFTTCESQLYSR